MVFPYKPSSYGGSPSFMETPISIHILLRNWLKGIGWRLEPSPRSNHGEKLVSSQKWLVNHPKSHNFFGCSVWLYPHVSCFVFLLLDISYMISLQGARPSDSRVTNCILNSPKSVWRCGAASILTSQLWKLGFCAHHLLDTGLFFFMFLADLLGGFASMCQECTWLTWSQHLSPHELLTTYTA